MNRFWPAPIKQPTPELFTVRAVELGRIELHVCRVCRALTLGDDDEQMAHAAWHVSGDRASDRR